MKELRKARDLTQDELAERSELSVDSIRRIERGAFSPSLDTLAKLARGLRLSLNGLFANIDRGAHDEVLELSDYLSTRSPYEIRMVTRVVHAIIDGAEERETNTVLVPERNQPANAGGDSAVDDPAAVRTLESVSRRAKPRRRRAPRG